MDCLSTLHARLPYVGKLDLELAVRLLDVHLPPGRGTSTVLDPFCGCGTTVLAARRTAGAGKAGLRVVASDASPLARCMTRCVAALASRHETRFLHLLRLLEDELARCRWGTRRYPSVEAILYAGTVRCQECGARNRWKTDGPHPRCARCGTPLSWKRIVHEDTAPPDRPGGHSSPVRLPAYRPVMFKGAGGWRTCGTRAFRSLEERAGKILRESHSLPWHILAHPIPAERRCLGRLKGRGPRLYHIYTPPALLSLLKAASKTLSLVETTDDPILLPLLCVMLEVSLLSRATMKRGAGRTYVNVAGVNLLRLSLPPLHVARNALSLEADLVRRMLEGGIPDLPPGMYAEVAEPAAEGCAGARPLAGLKKVLEAPAQLIILDPPFDMEVDYSIPARLLAPALAAHPAGAPRPAPPTSMEHPLLDWMLADAARLLSPGGKILLFYSASHAAPWNTLLRGARTGGLHLEWCALAGKSPSPSGRSKSRSRAALLLCLGRSAPRLATARAAAAPHIPGKLTPLPAAFSEALESTVNRDRAPDERLLAELARMSRSGSGGQEPARLPENTRRQRGESPVSSSTRR